MSRPSRHAQHPCASAKSSPGSPHSIVAVLPCTANDVRWLQAKLLSCGATLSAKLVQRVLVFAPRSDLPKLAQLALPAHWYLIAETDVMPPARRQQLEATPGWSNGWTRQQAIKLLSVHHRAAQEAQYLLMLDSDTLCTRGWRAPLAEHFIAADGRVRTCLEPLNGWHGATHVARSARRWNFTRWVDATPYYGKPGASREVLGWTPQLLSRAGLTVVEDVLLAREADTSSASRWERIASLLLSRASKPWTEYATYFLALDAARQWTRFHEPLSVCAHGSHAEAPSRRCDRPSFAWGASASRAVRGCLKVRADCVSELEMELRTDAVPFVTVNDHAKGMGGGAAALALLNGTSPRPRRLSAVHHPPPSRRRTRRLCPAGSTSRECTAPEFLVDDYVLGLFAHRRNRTFAECGANDGVNSHTRLFEEALGWRGTCIEASPANFAVLKKRRQLCRNVQAVLWGERANLTFRSFPHAHPYFGHSGLVSTRPKAEWKRLVGLNRSKWVHTDSTVAALPVTELVPPSLDWFVLDVEGAEMAVLDHFPWDAVRPRVWTVETNKLDRRQLSALMARHGYACFGFDTINTVCTSCVQKLTARSERVCL